MDSQISGLYNLSVEERLAVLQERARLDPDDVAILRETGLGVGRADQMIENVVGVHELPLGIATNFVVNGRDVLVPMVIEEPSVVAGASLAAKLARAGGGFSAHATKPVMIGQMQVLDIHDPWSARFALLDQKERLLSAANEVDPVIVNLGGGARDLQVRVFETSPVGPMLVVHLLYDCRDAMGANAVNTAAERLTPMIEEITGGRVLLRILSNLADQRLARARCSIPIEALAFGNFSGAQVAQGVTEAWAFAAVDPYRAATHNKGIMNGIDAVLIATGNDWRAVEAGAHAYAARNGTYTSLSTWSHDTEEGALIGTLELPMAVGRSRLETSRRAKRARIGRRHHRGRIGPEPGRHPCVSDRGHPTWPHVTARAAGSYGRWCCGRRREPSRRTDGARGHCACGSRTGDAKRVDPVPAVLGSGFAIFR
jgi:hydroxymethylglutaryl-CoA reductase